MKGKSKKVIAFGIIATIVILASILSAFWVTNVNKKSSNLSAEELKAMTYEEVSEEDAKVENCDYVQFSAFFTRDLNNDGYAEKLSGTCKEVSKEDNLYVELKVLSKGSLQNAHITLDAKNFTWTTAIVEDPVVKGNYIGVTNKINLQENVPCGTQKLLVGGITSDITNINDYSKESNITLTGTYVDEQGNKTQIAKTVKLTVDWYGKVETTLSTTEQTKNIHNILDEEKNEVRISFGVSTQEVKEQLILKDNIITIKVPEINGYKAVNAICSSGNINCEYDKDQSILQIRRSANVDGQGNVIEKLAKSNFYYIEVTYPKELYDSIKEDSMTVEIPVTVTYKGYNNSDEKYFKNPEESTKEGIITLVLENVDGEIYNYKVNVGERIQDSRYIILKDKVIDLYNNQIEEKGEDYYKVEWILYTGSGATGEGTVKKAIMKEQKDNYQDNFLNTSGEYLGMENYSDNVGIYFSGATSSLGEDGYIKVYNDETNELIHTFTKEDWSKYTFEAPYKYEEKIKHIRVETSEMYASRYFSVYNIKQLDDEKIAGDLNREEFDKLSNIYSYLEGSVVIGQNQEESLNRVGTASYESQISEVEINIEPKDITNQEVSKNQIIKINTVTDQINRAKWKNGEFIVKLPQEITLAEINSVKINNGKINLLGYDIYKENGNYFIKIITENEKEDTYEITINANLTPNPLEKTTYGKIEVYAYNEKCTDYYYKYDDKYDVNGNGNFEEKVGYDTASLQLIAPTTLITSETITNYDDEQNITTAPNIAKVTKKQRNANINVYVLNYYSSTISDAIILGEIPYVGNEYILNEGTLNSEFSVEMANTGIQVPDVLKNIVTVYYTENENATKDLTDDNNLWTKTPEDWSKVKRYLIDFGSYKIPKKAEYVFTYGVQIPEGIEYDKVSYSNHAIYFSLDTAGGKLPTETEPNKVGLRIARMFNLDITKNKAGTTIPVSGATYKLTEKEENGTIVSNRMATTSINGKLKINDLSINKIYTLKEIKAPKGYELNEDEITFKVTEDINENLVVNVISETKFANEPVIEKPQNAREVLTTVIEDLPKYQLVITKTDKETQKELKDIRFKILENEKEYKTSNEGIATIEGLTLNKTYTLREIKADGYYLPIEDYKFSLVLNDEGNYEFISDNLNATIDNTKETPSVCVDITNEKVPTYSLEILKVAENDEENKGLQGAKYQIKSKDTGNIDTYITDAEGKIEINHLYQYIEGKNATGIYTLQEVRSPYGYANNTEEITFRVEEAEVGFNIYIDNQETLESIKQVTTDENGIKIVLQDRPLFKLTKIDEETKEPIKNVKFIIYSTTAGGETIDYAKDVNENYIGEKNEDGDYVVQTNSNGEISLALPAGYFKAIEIEAPEKYNLPESEYERTQYFKTEGVKVDLEIDSIEDLLDFSKSVNEGDTFEGKLVSLTKTLDFMDENSYEDSNNKERYGDYNNDGTEEGIMAELNNLNGTGFIPIGAGYKGNTAKFFKGNFDGNGYEIRNIYINSANQQAKGQGALFGNIKNSNISNLKMTRTDENTREFDILCGDKLERFAISYSGICRL